MGGVGKTQLAANYARSAWQAGGVDVLVWITADSRTATVTRLAQAAAEILGLDSGAPQRDAQAFLAWLEPKAGQPVCRWLIVLDDVADPADLNGLWPPLSQHGQVVITTRRRDAALARSGRRVLEVGLFTRSEAVAYLAQVLAVGGRHEPELELDALAEDLGRLPLALAQAAAYLFDADIGCAAYRALLADRTRTLADAAPDALPDDQPYPVAAAWSLSTDRADALRPAGLARCLLQLAAFLDPNGIPQDVLIGPPALIYLTERRALALGSLAGQVTADEAVHALRVLHRLGLIDHTPDAPHQTVRVHQLIQRAVRDTVTAERHRLARTAADGLIAAWPEVERDTGLVPALRANTIVLTTHAESALYQSGMHEALKRTGNSLGEAGQVTAAIDYFDNMTAATAHHLGPDHHDALTTRGCLARWRGEAGDVAGAATAYAELLQDRMRVLGPDHPGTLTTRHNVAYWRGETGDAAGAATALAELLHDRIRLLGPDHPDTLTTRSVLAHWRGEAGEVVGAATAYAELLQDRMRVLGPDHP
ncbi:tetratricopeptide repeat protein, partial [Streptomyces sp. NPDC058202]|uniref:tetratricopeptide repeat protein n=1 Tax=Streptomyces sp. NPDC058202 TaxID=3346380 RepID=UPI0036E765D5